MPSSNIVIKVSSISKVYPLYNSHRDRLKEALHPRRKIYHKDFYALRDVSFEILKGETVAIIGQNGSGKSTLLKILSNVLTPTSGSSLVYGKVSSLLELGTGFNPELTGIENVYFNGTLLGFTKNELDARMDHILGFADIGEFARQPVKTYSSGMYVRLAFSVATQVNPDVLIVDEALSVGDMFFQAKCISRMKKMIESEGTTLLMVSHSMDTVKALCSRGILLNKGEVLGDCSAADAAQRYFELRINSRQKTIGAGDNPAHTVFESQADNNFYYQASLSPSDAFLRSCSFQRIRNGKAEFLNIQLLDEFENEIVNVRYGQTVVLRMVLEAHEEIHTLGYAYHIRDRNGVDLIYGSSGILDRRLTALQNGDVYIVDWTFSLQIMQGIYTIACVASVPLGTGSGEVDFCDFIPIACQFEMEQRYPTPLYGLVHIDDTVNIHKVRDKTEK